MCLMFDETVCLCVFPSVTKPKANNIKTTSVLIAGL